MITRRQFAASTPCLVAGPPALSSCSQEPAAEGYEAVAERTRQSGAVPGLGGAALGRELVRFATLAPSSHNTQCWTFALDANDRSIVILPDVARRCPAVDPDDHHVFVSLGCATENLIQAALAHGFKGEAQFDAAGGAVRVLLEPTRAQTTPWFTAIPLRQCTRGDYDGKPLSGEELTLLQRAGSSDTVRLLLLTERPAMEQTLNYVIQGNTAQLADAAFVTELKSWIRFNGADAVRTRDGLYSVSSGNPNIPSWVGDLAFRWAFTSKGENDKYARHVRSSAGIAVFVGQAADKAHWVEVGRCYERFALQATALGIRNAFLNQPVEVAALRPPFAAALGLAGQRPDLVVRFGRGPVLPRSLRRPVEAVLIWLPLTQKAHLTMTWFTWFVLTAAALVMAAMSLTVFGSMRWAEETQALTADLEAGSVPPPAGSPARYDASEIEGLPAPVQRYFRAALKPGQPIVTAATIQMTGTFNMSFTGEQWKPFSSRQRVITRRPGFLWDASISMLPGLTVRVVDSYIVGSGLLRATIQGLFPVADVRGSGEIARGEFMRYFAEAVWYPTALLPTQGVRWVAVDDRSANATLIDGPLSLTLLFRFDDAGLIESFRAEARGGMVGKVMVQAPWEGRFSNYQTRDGMSVPLAGEVAWIRPEGRKAYFDGAVTQLSYEFAS